MTLQPLELNEPIIAQLGELLAANLPAVIDAINTAAGDGIVVEHPAQILDRTATESDLKAGVPLIVIQDMPSTFEDDLQFSLEGFHELCVTSVIQNADHDALAKMLRRYSSAIARTIQADRMLGATGILKRSPAHVAYTKFVTVEPGPMLGEANPLESDAPPSSFLSWHSLVVNCRRTEIGF